MKKPQKKKIKNKERIRQWKNKKRFVELGRRVSHATGLSINPH